jgi:cation diffusion facilitator CzcD-associated flavoprotein CzcO
MALLDPRRRGGDLPRLEGDSGGHVVDGMSVQPEVLDLAIIGSGFGGLGAGVMAKRRDIESFVILERDDAVGGTWRDNTYPGCACDIPSHLYSFSFAPNPEWSRSYPAQPEIEAYLERVTDDHGLRPHIRFGFAVSELRWLDDENHWRIEAGDGRVIGARTVICATGPLSQPSIPGIDGLSEFRGAMFHSARWDHSHDMTGERVGVIGTGASSIQLVPAIAPSVDSLTVFQRTPAWVLPRDDRPAPRWRRRLYRRVPFLQRLHRWRIYFRQEILAAAFIGRGRLAASMTDRVIEESTAQIESSISDPVLAGSLVPDHKPGCKRLLIANDWFPTLARENVHLVTAPIGRITADGIRTSDGIDHDLDAIVFATGFSVTDFPAPMRILGRRGEDLADHWENGASTDFGVAVSGYPNLWFLAGPGTGLGHNSIVFMIEVQLRMIGQAIDHLRTRRLTTLELRPEVEASSYAELQRRIATTVWTSGCSSWYRTADGRVDTIWPGTTIEYWWRARRFRSSRYLGSAARFGDPPPAR